MTRVRLFFGGALAVALMLASPASAGKPGARQTDPAPKNIPSEFAYLTTADRRAVEFYRDGDRELHRADVVDKCGPPEIGEPKIRDIRRAGPVIEVTYGKHCWAAIAVADQSIRCTGCD